MPGPANISGNGVESPRPGPGAHEPSLLSDFLEAKGELAVPDEVLASHLPPPTDLRPRVGA